MLPVPPTLGLQRLPCPPHLLCLLCRTLQDMVFKTYVSPEHYFLQIDPEAEGG